MSRGSPCAQLPPLPSPLQDPPQTWHPWLGPLTLRGHGAASGQGASISTGLPPQDLRACLPLPVGWGYRAHQALFTLLCPCSVASSLAIFLLCFHGDGHPHSLACPAVYLL